MGDNYLALPNVQRSRFLYKDLMKNKELDQKIIKAYKIIEDKIIKSDFLIISPY